MGLNRKMNFCGYSNLNNCMAIETVLPNMEQTAGCARNVKQWKHGKVKAQLEHLVCLYILEFKCIREFVPRLL